MEKQNTGLLLLYSESKQIRLGMTILNVYRRRQRKAVCLFLGVSIQEYVPTTRVLTNGGIYNECPNFSNVEERVLTSLLYFNQNGRLSIVLF